MAYHIEKMDARFGRKVYYVGNNQWNTNDTHKLVFSDLEEAQRECNNVRGTLVEE